MPSHFQRHCHVWRLQGGPHAFLRQSPTYLNVTPASLNMSLAAVVSSLSWYLSDMKITSFIPEKVTVEDKPGHKMQKRGKKDRAPRPRLITFSKGAYRQCPVTEPLTCGLPGPQRGLHLICLPVFMDFVFKYTNAKWKHVKPWSN